MGDGKRRAELERSAPPNVEFPGPASGKEQVAALAARSGACLTFFKDVPVLATNSPNKLFDTFAAGRPAIVNMDGWMRRLVEDNDAGMYVRAGDAQDLAQKLALAARAPRGGRAHGAQRPGACRARVRPRQARRPRAVDPRGGRALTALSYCVVNTNGREWLMACLTAIDRTHPPGVSYEVLVLDNASEDGSAEAVRDAHPAARLIALERRSGKAENDSRLLQEARGELCLLLNEDTELREGATRALLDALDGDPRAGAAGAQLLTSDGEQTACAWRLPNAGWALAGALFMHDSYAVQSHGNSVRRVGWVQSSAMMVRRGRRRGDRLVRPGLLRLLGRDRLLPAPARRRLARAVRAAGGGGAPRPAVHRRRGDAAAHRRVSPRSRPLLPQAPDARRARCSGGSAGRGPTWPARLPRPCCRATARAATWPTRASSSTRTTARACASWREEYNRRRADGLPRTNLPRGGAR